MTQPSLLVSIPEAADLMRISPREVTRLIAKRAIATKKIGRRRLIPRLELERFCAVESQRPTAPASAVMGLVEGPETADPELSQ